MMAIRLHLLLAISASVSVALFANAQFWDEKNDEVNYTPEEISKWIGLPADFTSRKAAEKAELLWEKVKQTNYSQEELPTWDVGASGWFHFTRVALLSLSPAFTCNRDNGDVLPTGRMRGIHNLGVVGRVQMTMFDNVTRNNFTGFLAKGTTGEGMVRLSITAAPEMVGRMFGMGLKMLIDGKPSVDTVGLYNSSGQGSNTNVFHKSFRTTLPKPATWLLKVVDITRNQVEYPARSLPVRDLTKFTPDGKSIENFYSPFMLDFRPHERVANLISDNSTMETRTELKQKLTPGPLFNVYAATGLDDPNAFQIGQVSLKTGVLPSEFGDKRLCFKHQRNKAKDEL